MITSMDYDDGSCAADSSDNSNGTLTCSGIINLENSNLIKSEYCSNENNQTSNTLEISSGLVDSSEGGGGGQSASLLNSQLEIDCHKNMPFEYENCHGYLYTRLKWIIENNEINFELKNELHSLLETLGELRILGVYNEQFKKYRKAFDSFSLKLDISNGKEDVIGELRYQCYQSSASGRKELKLIEKSVKEWNKREKEKKLLNIYKDAMSSWLNGNGLGVDKNLQAGETRGLFEEILDSTREMNSPLQQSQLLSYLSTSYISEKLFPYMASQVSNSNSGASHSGNYAEIMKPDTPNANRSISSIEVNGDNSDELTMTFEEKIETNNEHSIETAKKNTESIQTGIKNSQNESVMSWIKSSINRKHEQISSKSESSLHNGDVTRMENIKQALFYRDEIISKRLEKKLCDIIETTSFSHKYNKDHFLTEFNENYRSIYENFISLKENQYNGRKYYKSIPIIGSNRPKKQIIEIEEVISRQFQSVYNEGDIEVTLEKIRRVLIYRSEWKRPPMFLLITRRGKECTGINPLVKEEHINYDIETDEEWEEQFGGEDVENVDEVPDPCDEDDDDAIASGWLVPDGYFQSDELIDDYTISNVANGNENGVVSLLPPSSKYPSPVVASFLNHSSMDYGVGISVPDESYINCIIGDYLAFLTQKINWIYGITDSISRNDLNISSRESVNSTGVNLSSITNPNLSRRSVLDSQLKQELSYFVHGKWVSTKKIIDEFIELNSNRDIKRAAILQFLKENVYKAKLEGDVRYRWYVNENTTEYKLDADRLHELLLKRKMDGTIFKGETKNGKSISHNRICTSNIYIQTKCPEKFQVSEVDRKELVTESPQTPNYNDLTTLPTRENCPLESDRNTNSDSQSSTKSMEGYINDGFTSQRSEQLDSQSSQTIDKVSKKQFTTNKRRKCSTPTKCVLNENYSLPEQDSDGNRVSGKENNRSNTLESKRSCTPVGNNSLITYFFPPKSKGL
ncbi:Chromatin assembly factor 1 subunit A family protein [Cryptosporidium felis]|nr:Chromatin assembly factor 1 subunit A family protein [Cryptosporidium felis]